MAEAPPRPPAPAPSPDPSRPALRVKICGVTRPEDAGAAAAAGADLVGAILSPGFARSVPPETARRCRVEAGLPLVAVTVDAPPDEVLRAAGLAGASVLQLHGDETPEGVARLLAEGPWTVWKAVRVRSGAEVRAALARWTGVVHGLVVEGWHEGRGGGAGAAFPWDEVASVRAGFPAQLGFVAAGGLDPDNVAEAVRRLRPDVVDVSSGVEARRGVKDPGRLQAFVAAARRAVDTRTEAAGAGPAPPGGPAARGPRASRSRLPSPPVPRPEPRS